jgi:formylglycine-generating enzyme required for sulfatase activity
VEKISWFQATEFCNELSKKFSRTPCYYYDSNDQYQCNWEANGFRLPTEAEWEYACRAGTTNTYFWGSTGTEAFSKLFAWFSANANDSLWTDPHALYSGTQPVAQKSPNAWGFYDMVGNVWEWCWDYYGADYYSVSPATDPHGPDTGTDVVIRGNSWYETDWATYNRPSFRYFYGKASFDIGFRVCYHN